MHSLRRCNDCVYNLPPGVRMTAALHQIVQDMWQHKHRVHSQCQSNAYKGVTLAAAGGRVCNAPPADSNKRHLCRCISSL